MNVRELFCLYIDTWTGEGRAISDGRSSAQHDDMRGHEGMWACGDEEMKCTSV
jgi:hypothetical protein